VGTLALRTNVAVALVTVLAVMQQARAEDIVIASKTGPPVEIVVASTDPLMRKTALWCRDFLVRRGLAVQRHPVASPTRRKGPLWVLETKGQCRIAKSLGLDCSFLETARADAYILNVFEKLGRPVVSIVGRNTVGTRSGVARLVALLVDQGERLTAPKTREERSPFFGIREITISNRGKMLQGTPWADTLWRRWSDQRIEKYAEQLWLLGFNSLQTIEGRSFRAATADKAQLQNVVHKTRVLMRAARENGMLVTQWIWGQAPYDDKMCWNSPADRAIIQEEFRWMARTYGRYVDRVYVHVRDPGGCPRGKDCKLCDDYRTPQEVATFVLKEYRKVNPKVTVTLSTWFNPKFWNGAPGVRFLDETYSPRDVGIALHKWYDADKAKMVRDAGRAVDIWSWYMSDYETISDMSLCMRKVDSYFSSLPDQASRDVRVISTELCFHGWPNILTAYVSAQKMWSPHRNLQEIEREFCAGMFGEKNADAMVAVYQACESIVHPPRNDARIPSLAEVWGKPEYNRQFRTALEKGKKVVLDPSRPPKLTSATEPRALVDYLIRNLSLVTVLSEAQEKVDAAKAAGASREELMKIVEDAVRQAEPFKIDIDYPGLVKRLRDSIETASQPQLRRVDAADAR